MDLRHRSNESFKDQKINELFAVRAAVRSEKIQRFLTQN